MVRGGPQDPIPAQGAPRPAGVGLSRGPWLPMALPAPSCPQTSPPGQPAGNGPNRCPVSPKKGGESGLIRVPQPRGPAKSRRSGALTSSYPSPPCPRPTCPKFSFPQLPRPFPELEPASAQRSPSNCAWGTPSLPLTPCPSLGPLTSVLRHLKDRGPSRRLRLQGGPGLPAPSTHPPWASWPHSATPPSPHCPGLPPAGARAPPGCSLLSHRPQPAPAWLPPLPLFHVLPCQLRFLAGRRHSHRDPHFPRPEAVQSWGLPEGVIRSPGGGAAAPWTKENMCQSVRPARTHPAPSPRSRTLTQV